MTRTALVQFLLLLSATILAVAAIIECVNDNQIRSIAFMVIASLNRQAFVEIRELLKNNPNKNQETK